MIRRPSFYEGQILGSEDLERTVQYSREQDSRHDRYLHTWGLAEGLELIEQNGGWFLTPGFAIDSTGSPIVVTEPLLFQTDQVFDDSLPSEKDSGKWVPAFVFRHETPDEPDTLIQRCGDSAPSRIRENAKLVFRSILTGWDEQDKVPISSGPSDRPDPTRIVLIGFVKWEKDDQKSKGTISEFRRLDDNGNGPKYAGVSADDVIARGGELALWSRRPAEKVGSPAMILGDYRPKDNQDRKALRLGVDNGDGILNELLTVDPQGNLFVKGNIDSEGVVKGKLTKGEVSIESGIAHDGMTLPLPPEITYEQLESGAVVLHTSATPNLDPLVDPSITKDHVPVAVECSVNDKLLVQCLIRWFVPGNDPQLVEVAGSVNYTILAYVNEAETGNAS